MCELCVCVCVRACVAPFYEKLIVFSSEILINFPVIIIVPRMYIYRHHTVSYKQADPTKF